MRPSLLNRLFASVTTLAGIAEKSAMLYRKLTGRDDGARVVDLLFHPAEPMAFDRPPSAGAGTSFRQGLLSNLFSQKIGIFFTSFIPQFIGPGDAPFGRLLLLGAIFNAMGVCWLFGYAVFVSCAGDILRWPRIKAVIERITGAILIGFGIRLAAEHR